MSTIDELVAQIPIDQVASQLGVDDREAERLTRQALPALLGGMEANAQDSGGAASLAAALDQHDDDLLDGGVDLGQVNTDDGAKIVRHVFGDNEDQVVRRLGGSGDSGLMGKLLPILAPIVMSYLAKQFLGGKSRSGGGGGDSLGGLGDLLGGILGGGAGGGGAGGLGDLLGGLLGGGSRR